jgi:glycosyltransferase involved in cell wall biosynthesis
MAKIDVLLPFWGDVELLTIAVESVLAQTEPDWQLFVADDCYPSDEPEKYFKKLADPRINYIRHKHNIGVTANFNYVLDKASSPYCVLMGCDDKMLPAYIATALSRIGDAAMYQPGVEVINKEGRVYLPLGDRIKRTLQPHKPGNYQGEKLATSLCHGNWLYFPSILWKTDVIKRYGFNKEYGVTQDVYLQMNIIIDGGSLYLDKTHLFQYRRFNQSVSSREKSTGKRFKEEARVYAHYAEVFKAMHWDKAYRAAKFRITHRLNKLIS